MWPFKAAEPTDETLAQRMRKLEKRQLDLEEQLMDVAHSQDIMRDKVLRKLQERRKKAEEEEETDMHGLLPTKELNSRVGM